MAAASPRAQAAHHAFAQTLLTRAKFTRAILALPLAACAAMTPAQAQTPARPRVSCEAYARDYAAMVAPRSGGPLVSGLTQGLPNPAARDARSARAPARDSARRGADLAAQRNAYAAALARCRAGG